MNYAYFPNEKTYVHFGYSIDHVNGRIQWKTFFFTANLSDSSRITNSRHIIFADALLKVSDNVIINPNAYFTMQAKATEAMLGMTANFKLTDGGEKQLILGLYDRLGDAVIPLAGFEINNNPFYF